MQAVTDWLERRRQMRRLNWLRQLHELKQMQQLKALQQLKLWNELRQLQLLQLWSLRRRMQVDSSLRLTLLSEVGKRMMVDRVNLVREAHHVSPLKREPFIDELAMSHSHYMAESRKCSHHGFEWRASAIGARLGRFRVGENCFMYPSKQYTRHIMGKIVDGWMNSPGHRGNILNPCYRSTGIGWLVSNGYVWATQIFAD